MAWNGAPWPVWGCAPKRGYRINYKAHEGEIIGEKNGFLIIHCQVCILNHVVNLPSEEFLRDYYSKQFYKFSKPDYLARYEEDRWWWELHHGYTVNQALMLLRGSTAHYDEDSWERKLTVLDVGSGPGIFLDVAQRSGFITYGVEPCDEIAQLSRARGHAVLTGMLTDEKIGQYDMIHCYETLEHVSQPEEFLLKCYDLLLPGGVLFVVVPNDYNLLQLEASKRFNLGDYWLAPPEHLNYFEPKTLQIMVRRCGFKIHDIRTTYPLERFMLENNKIYVGNDQLGRECHRHRMSLEKDYKESGKWEDLMEMYRDQCSDPYSGTFGREICLMATKE